MSGGRSGPANPFRIRCSAIQICHTQPTCLKIGGKFFSEAGQKEIYYLLGRTLALMRPELALSRLAAEQLEALFQAAISSPSPTSGSRWIPRARDEERKRLEKVLSARGRAALGRVAQEYVRTATPGDFETTSKVPSSADGQGSSWQVKWSR